MHLFLRLVWHLVKNGFYVKVIKSDSIHIYVTILGFTFYGDIIINLANIILWIWQQKRMFLLVLGIETLSKELICNAALPMATWLLI